MDVPQQTSEREHTSQGSSFPSPWMQFKQFWKSHRWPILVGAECVLLALGYIGFARYTAALGESRSPLDLLYLTLQLVTLESGAVSGPVGWELEVARLALPAVSAYTALAAFAALFERQIESIRLWFTGEHVVICGLGRKGYLLARRFLEQGDRVVVIEQDEACEWLGPCRQAGAIALIGDARSAEMLRKARIGRARWLIAVCGDDGANAEIGVRAQAARLVARRHGTLNCVVHIVNAQLCTLLRECEINSEQDPVFRLGLFNVFDLGARALLDAHLPRPRAERGPACALHLVVVGLGGFGESLVVHAARGWWNQHGASGPQLRISAIDRGAEWKCASLEVRYPQLREACDLIPCQMDVLSPTFRQAPFLYDAQGQCTADAVYICLDHDSLALQAGLTLLQRTRSLHIPIVIRVAQESGLAMLLSNNRAGSSFRDLHPFSLLDQTCTTALVQGGTHEALARAIHDQYVRTQRALGAVSGSNPALQPWDALPEQLKESNRRQADHIGYKLQAVSCETVPLARWDAAQFRFTPQEIERMAQMEHERWAEDLRREGWTHAPGTRNDAQKTHPALVPWEQLPEADKEKNRAVARELPTFLARAGFEIHRL
jgi:NAD(P)-dependent dehydrogenase (short-subunit alcohol dehydrogenase family)